MIEGTTAHRDPTTRSQWRPTDCLTAGASCPVVVSDDRHRVEGLIAERDVVRAIAYRGSDATHLAAASVMSTAVPTCTSSSDVLSVMRTMTDRRFRHMPVLDDGALVGIVSIGDVVKQRLEELELEAMVLRDGFRSRH